MIRGTTPTIYLKFELDWDDVYSLTVTFAQKHIVFKLPKERFTYEDGKISATLTQSETLALKENEKCEVQIKFKTLFGKVGASEVVTVDVGRILDEVTM